MGPGTGYPYRGGIAAVWFLRGCNIHPHTTGPQSTLTTRILMIDDDEQLSAMVAEYLGNAGYTVDTRPTATEGLRALESGEHAAVLLDVMLPDLDGFEVCKRLRATHSIPVLMLTARGEETDRIVGLELGADDYLPKPFNPRELLARLRAILRRGNAVTPDGKIMRFGALVIDAERRRVSVSGRACDLTSHQFEILRVLGESAGKVLSRDKIMDRVRGEALESFDRSIDVHISRIRAEIEDDSRNPRRLITVRGAGYVLSRDAEDGH